MMKTRTVIGKLVTTRMPWLYIDPDATLAKITDDESEEIAEVVNYDLEKHVGQAPIVTLEIVVLNEEAWYENVHAAFLRRPEIKIDLEKHLGPEDKDLLDSPIVKLFVTEIENQLNRGYQTRDGNYVIGPDGSLRKIEVS